MKKYKVTFTCVGDRVINLVFNEEQHTELLNANPDGYFSLRVGEKREYRINMRNVVSIYINETEADAT